MEEFERRYIEDEENLSYDEDKREFVLLSPVYNRDSKPMWGAPDGGRFIERVMPGACKRSLEAGDNVLCRIEHQSGLMVLGSTKAGTVRLEDGPDGVTTHVELPDTTAARDLVSLYNHGEYRTASFAFRVREGGERWHKDEESGHWIRELTDIVLKDTAPVMNPAYIDASAALRNAPEEARRAILGEEKEEKAFDKVAAAARRRRLRIAELANG